jgi:hypothetical protein
VCVCVLCVCVRERENITPFTYLLHTAAGIRPVYRTLLLETVQLEKYNTKHIQTSPFSVTLLSAGTLPELEGLLLRFPASPRDMHRRLSLKSGQVTTTANTLCYMTNSWRWQGGLRRFRSRSPPFFSFSLVQKSEKENDIFHDHREASALVNELPEESDQFRFLHAACFANLKGSVGLFLAKTSDMRISIPIDLSSRPFIPLPTFIRSRCPTPLLAPSLVLFPPRFA